MSSGELGHLDERRKALHLPRIHHAGLLLLGARGTARHRVAERGQMTQLGALGDERHEIDADEIDARGISSPLHVLRAHRALRAMPPGQVLRVLTTSEQTIAEFQALAKYVVAYELLAQEQIGDEVIHVLRRKR